MHDLQTVVQRNATAKSQSKRVRVLSPEVRREYELARKDAWDTYYHAPLAERTNAMNVLNQDLAELKLTYGEV